MNSEPEGKKKMTKKKPRKNQIHPGRGEPQAVRAWRPGLHEPQVVQPLIWSPSLWSDSFSLCDLIRSGEVRLRLRLKV